MVGGRASDPPAADASHPGTPSIALASLVRAASDGAPPPDEPHAAQTATARAGAIIRKRGQDIEVRSMVERRQFSEEVPVRGSAVSGA